MIRRMLRTAHEGTLGISKTPRGSTGLQSLLLGERDRRDGHHGAHSQDRGHAHRRESRRAAAPEDGAADMGSRVSAPDCAKCAVRPAARRAPTSATDASTVWAPGWPADLRYHAPPYAVVRRL